MATILWELPVPSTALEAGGPVFEKRMRREVSLRMSYESDSGEEIVALVFDGVEAYKATYYHARAASMIEAHDRLVDLGHTEWLSEVAANLQQHRDDVA